MKARKELLASSLELLFTSPQAHPLRSVGVKSNQIKSDNYKILILKRKFFDIDCSIYISIMFCLTIRTFPFSIFQGSDYYYDNRKHYRSLKKAQIFQFLELFSQTIQLYIQVLLRSLTILHLKLIELNCDFLPCL